MFLVRFGFTIFLVVYGRPGIDSASERIHFQFGSAGGHTKICRQIKFDARPSALAPKLIGPSVVIKLVEGRWHLSRPRKFSQILGHRWHSSTAVNHIDHDSLYPRSSASACPLRHRPVTSSVMPGLTLTKKTKQNRHSTFFPKRSRIVYKNKNKTNPQTPRVCPRAFRTTTIAGFQTRRVARGQTNLDCSRENYRRTLRAKTLSSAQISQSVVSLRRRENPLPRRAHTRTADPCENPSRGRNNIILQFYPGRTDDCVWYHVVVHSCCAQQLRRRCNNNIT